jgi:ADP-ribose diphosphatase
MIEPDIFRKMMRQLASGVFVVTTRLGERPHATTATAFVPLSAEPPLVLLCVGWRSHDFYWRFANGNVREFERVSGSTEPGAVIIVPLSDSGSLLLVREYAVGLERYELHLPMGLVQATETTLQAANRELQEETGYAAREMQALHTLALAPRILGYKMDVLATGLYASSSLGDEPEPLEVVAWPLERLDELPLGGEIADARTLAALFVARQALMRARQTTPA